MKKTIKIQDKEYIIENDNIIALMKFEEIWEQVFGVKKNAYTNTNYNLNDTVYMLYATLVICNDNFNINVDDFKKLINADKSIVHEYFKFLGEQIVESKKKAIAKPA